MSDEEFAIKLCSFINSKPGIILSLIDLCSSQNLDSLVSDFNCEGQFGKYIAAHIIQKRLSNDEDRLKLILLVGDYLL